MENSQVYDSDQDEMINLKDAELCLFPNECCCSECTQREKLIKHKDYYDMNERKHESSSESTGEEGECDCEACIEKRNGEKKLTNTEKLVLKKCITYIIEGKIDPSNNPFITLLFELSENIVMKFSDIHRYCLIVMRKEDLCLESESLLLEMKFSRENRDILLVSDTFQNILTHFMSEHITLDDLLSLV